MKRMLVSGVAGLSCLVLAASALPAKAMMIRAPSPGERVATADCVVVGKVLKLEDKTVRARRFEGDKEEYTIAVVKVEDRILGARGLTHVRVAFIKPQAMPPGGGPVGRPGGPVIFRPGIRRYPQANLVKDQEACLFLTRHPRESFYTLPAYFDILNKKDNANFDKEIKEIKHSAQLLADPEKGLTAKSADDRFLTAALLLIRYKTPKGPFVGPPRTRPIDAKQSKLILKALAEADWTAANNARLGFINPLNMFNRLGLMPRDGWVPPMDFRQFPEAAKKWLNSHASTYRIQRYVASTEKK